MARIADISDLQQELWLREREEKKIVWKTKEGKEIPIQEMTLSHLKSTINMLDKQMFLQELKAEYDSEDFGDR